MKTSFAPPPAPALPSPILTHLTEELEAIRKAITEGNPGRADWLCRTAIKHIADHQPTAAPPADTIDLLRQVLAHFEFISSQNDQGRLHHLERWHQDHEPLRRQAEALLPEWAIKPTARTFSR